MSEEHRVKLPELRGKENFAGWYKLTDTYLLIKGLKKDNGEFVSEKKGEAYLYLISTLSYNIAAEVPIGIDPLKLVNFLKKQYGCSNPYQAMDRFDKVKMTNIDPIHFISDLRKSENQVIIAGGSITAREKFVKLLSGINQGFYGSFIQQNRMKYEDVEKTDDIIETLCTEMKSFYDASTIEQREPYERYGKTIALATEKKSFEKRKCDYCEDNHPKIYKTHNTIDCRKKEKKGVENANKEGSLYFDTCASEHFSNNTLKNFQPSSGGAVEGSNGSKSSILGTGTMKMGNLNLKNVQFAPDLKFNLVSAAKIIEDGYSAVIKKSSCGEDLKI
jgi:hypothetical protein